MARIRPVQTADVAKIPQSIERQEPPAPPPVNRAPATIVPSRRPPPALLDKAQESPFVLLHVEGGEGEPAKEITTDEITFALTKLYLSVEKIAETDDSLEVRQGLQALEAHLRLMEYVRKCRSSLLVD